MASPRRTRSRVIAIVSSILMVGALTGLIAAMASAPSAPIRPTAAPVRSSDPSVSLSHPFTLGHAFPFTSRVDTLNGHPTTLARGSRGTVVIAMASWCLYCGYEDKWVLPVLAHTPGVTIDVVDVSPRGGIADPGPQTPPFSGHDGSGGPLTTAGMESVMQQYVKAFGTLSAPSIHVYVAPASTRQAWQVTMFPTLAFINHAGRVAVAPPGAQTLPQAQADLQQALHS